jgi:hypothetical protein
LDHAARSLIEHRLLRLRQRLNGIGESVDRRFAVLVDQRREALHQSPRALASQNVRRH